MGKGEVWVNGDSIGRYWVSFLTSHGNSSQTLYVLLFIYYVDFAIGIWG